MPALIGRLQVDDTRRILETAHEKRQQARVRADIRRHHLNRDLGSPRHRQQMHQLVIHDLGAADATAQYAFIDDGPQRRWAGRWKIACRSMRALTSWSTSSSLAAARQARNSARA